MFPPHPSSALCTGGHSLTAWQREGDASAEPGSAVWGVTPDDSPRWCTSCAHTRQRGIRPERHGPGGVSFLPLYPAGPVREPAPCTAPLHLAGGQEGKVGVKRETTLRLKVLPADMGNQD